MANQSGGGRRGGGARGLSAGTIVIVAVLFALVVAFVAVVVLDSRQGASSGPPDGTEEVDVGQAGQHTEENVDYEQTPPAGGEHNPAWQNCGVYEEPVRNETAVHSLEHGAVWITYRPDLSEGQVQQLEDLAQGESYVLVSPMQDLPSPIVVSAWGQQLQVEEASDERIQQFKSAFLQGPQTPEPGAACSGGVGEPV
ncbi:DUF3105 domain-containing protein [Rubrobacter aplysinae]|uniref:DUF3105 domain-containing protein n=1 Tax=Rubrobacter aplysinae TaxID=909625 RepID=UPI000A04FB9A|nr:DUF3105 domain-containing protein [Rubrobacter aplysinae]